MVADEQAFVHGRPEDSLYWYWTEARPLPASAAVEASVTEAERFAASAVIVASARCCRSGAR